MSDSLQEGGARPRDGDRVHILVRITAAGRLPGYGGTESGLHDMGRFGGVAESVDALDSKSSGL